VNDQPYDGEEKQSSSHEGWNAGPSLISGVSVSANKSIWQGSGRF
jgi:hypothetical protein